MNSQDLYPLGDSNHHTRSDMLIAVDFKWLMAGIGCWIDPKRLRNDPAYANASLERALASDCEPLQRCAIELKEELGCARTALVCD